VSFLSLSHLPAEVRMKKEMLDLVVVENWNMERRTLSLTIGRENPS
jgi:hypothetical protein